MIEADPATRDLRTLYLAAFLRALATGMVGVLVGLYLARLGFDELEMGSVITVGLGGAALAALVVTLGAHRLGHRSTLVVVSLLGAAGGVVVATSSATAVISAAAFVGMLNGMGRDRGAALILDQAILPATVSDAERTKAFAWYNVMQDAGHALGSVLAAAPAVVQALSGASELGGFRASLLLYASIHLVTAGVYTRLGSGAAHTPRRQPARISPESRRVLWKITALLSFFFHERFGAGPVAVGALFFLARVANAFSHLGAAWLARRIGLVNTMVFTHIPSSLLLLTVPFAPSFSVAAVLFVLREGLVEMDVPTRQSYVMAVVRPDERTFASGITHLVRLASWAVAPAFAGLLMRSLALGAPLFVGASMKIAYDLLLYAAFRHHRPPEERDR
jgi:MFS family permease